MHNAVLPLTLVPETFKINLYTMAQAGEPIDTEARQAQDLPPSYADAAKEAPGASPAARLLSLKHDHETAPPVLADVQVTTHKSHNAQVLTTSTSNNTQNGTAHAKSQHDINGDHDDETPSTPRAFHRPFSARHSIDASHDMPSADEHENGIEYHGQGTYESPITSARRGHIRAASRTTNGTTQPNHAASRNPNIKQAMTNGDDHLETIKTTTVAHRQDDMGMPNVLRSKSSKQEIHGGRQAGQGWQASA